MRSLQFIDLDLQADPYRTQSIGSLFDSPIRQIIAEELARSDNAVAVYRKYTARDFTLSGNIREATSDALDSAIDQLKSRLLNRRGDLKAGWAGGYRYFDAECKNVNIARGATDLTQCGWSAQFYMPVPFSTDGSTQDLISAVSGQTAGSSQLAVSNIGTYLALPYFTITLTGLEPNTSDVTITIGNPASSEYLEITSQFADGDVLYIDTVNEQIFKNSTLLNPVGNWPAWAPGAGILDYSDTGSSRTINITATYEPRYL